MWDNCELNSKILNRISLFLILEKLVVERLRMRFKWIYIYDKKYF